ncbi:AEC family transporter [Rubrobacter marinus]|uniref:AEC family transporter n=1 Tax=Rubrobacter marinus TaxID=2653852 RepID=A0A6G8PYJ5_9ACTN|nr:AEC family transporter [Rubrobacter marinus]QIN79282.1 AEC family transporter [Rubrobacter marinus]
MATILDTVLPFFALIFCGYGAARFGVLDTRSAAGLNSFVFYFALPAFLFSLMSASPIGEVLNLPFILAYSSTSLALFGLAALGGRALFGVGKGEAAVLGLAAVLPNTGYMGIPLISTALGQEAALPIVVGLIIDGVLLIPIAIAIITAGKGAGGSTLGNVGSTLAALTRNPIIVSIFAGLLFSAASPVALPGTVAGFLDLLAAATGPCALFALGATLASRSVSGAAEVSYMTFLKLFVHPAALWLAATLVFGVDPLWAVASTLGVALPIAANVFIVARQYDTYVERTSSAIFVSTSVSVVTVSVLLALLNPA